MHPLLGPLDGMERGAYDLVGPGLRHFFRDVGDHLRLVDEEVVAQRDLLAIILQANMAVVSVAQRSSGSAASPSRRRCCTPGSVATTTPEVLSSGP